MFLVMVTAVLVARFRLLTHPLPLEAWAAHWRRTLAGGSRPGWRDSPLLAPLVPVVVLVLVVLLLRALEWGVLVYLLAFLVLVACFHPADMKAGLAAYVDDLKREDIQAAFHDAQNIDEGGGESTADSWQELRRQTLAAASLRYYHCYFPVIFWFGVLGMGGALFYRLVQIAAMQAEAESEERRSLGRLLFILDWLPARLFGIALALIGNFKPVIALVRESINDGRLGTAGLIPPLVSAAVNPDGSPPAPDTPSTAVAELEELPLLVDRALVIWLAGAGLVAVLG